MKNFLTPTWKLATIFLVASTAIFAQEKEVILTNYDVIEMVRVGLSEEIIATKIKSSKTNFDTSATKLLELKDRGVSDVLVMAMIEKGQGTRAESMESAKALDTQKPVLEPRHGVGKRRIFIETEDEESKVEFTKRLLDKKFTVVRSRQEAELVFEFSIDEGTTPARTGIFRGTEAIRKTRTGNLVIIVREDAGEGIIFARLWEPKFSFGDGVPPGIRDQIRWFFIPEFIKLLNKAGDRIK